jgi:hypothetical protein
LLDFLEPELTFEVLARSEEVVRVRIVMCYGMGVGTDGSERRLDLEVPVDALAAAARALADEANAYPER